MYPITTFGIFEEKRGRETNYLSLPIEKKETAIAWDLVLAVLCVCVVFGSCVCCLDDVEINTFLAEGE